MNQNRRKILISASALPMSMGLSLGLSACGGGGDSAEGAAPMGHDGRAQAQSVTPQAIPINITNAAGNTTGVDSVFAPVLVGGVSDVSLRQLQYDATKILIVKDQAVYRVNISDRVVIGTTTYIRDLTLALSAPKTVGGKVYSFVAGANKGSLFVTVLNPTGAPTHYDYVLNGGEVTIAPPTTPPAAGVTSVAQLTFNLLSGTATQSQTIGGTVINLATGSNASVYSVGLSSTPISMTYAEQASSFV